MAARGMPNMAGDQVRFNAGNATRVYHVATSQRYKLVALIIWAMGCYTTYQFMIGLKADVDWWWAVVAQFVLTVCESDYFQGRADKVSRAAVVADTIINAIGVFPLLSNIGNTNVWDVTQQLTQTSGTPSMWVAALLSLLVGYIIAAAPERMWR